MNIVLHEPGIALNTGNIGRTCAATNTALHLIRPYGFRITEKEIKRAGMDYWEKIELHEYIDYEDFMEQHPELGNKEKDSNRDRDRGRSAEDTAAVEYAPAGTAGMEYPAVYENTVEIKDTEASENTADGRSRTDGKALKAHMKQTASPRLWFATTKARQAYTDVSFGPDDYIMLGNESRGIPEEILVQHPEACIRIPMWGDIRSLNLANSAAVILYEALRQNGFENMKKRGSLHRLSWDESPKAAE